jgi:hypothetical protein
MEHLPEQVFRRLLFILPGMPDRGAEYDNNSGIALIVLSLASTAVYLG